MIGPYRLGDRLLDAGLITRSQLDAALDQQRTRIDGGLRLGRTLVDLGFLAERDLLQMLSVFHGIPVAPCPIADAEERALTALPAYLGRRYRAVPCRMVRGSLLVAVTDALPPEAVEEMQKVSGYPVLLCLGPEAEIEAALARHYAKPSILPSRLRELATQLLQLTERQERLALALAGSERGTRMARAEERLGAELAHVHGNIETLLQALTEASREFREAVR